MENSKTDFITVINSVLLLIDDQINTIKLLKSGDTTEIKNSVVASAKAASILKVPVILTSLNSNDNGIFLKEITDLLPKNEVIDRSSLHPDVFEEQKVFRALRKTGREKLIIAGLWTSKTFLASACRAIREGYDVYGLIDACGDISMESHIYGIQRMRSAGVTSLTWMSITAEWMNGNSVPTETGVTDEVYEKYAAMLSYLSSHRPEVHF